MAFGVDIYEGQLAFANERRAEQLVTDRSGQGGLGITIRALPENRSNMYVGRRETTERIGYILTPGESCSIDVLNAGMIYVLGVRGEGCTWIGLTP